MSMIPALAPMEILHHEGLIRQMYLDSVNVPTWSVGMTDATGHRVARYRDNPAPLEHCLKVFVWALENYSNRVFAAFGDTPMNPHELAGAISFHWNTGAITSASWVDAFKDGDMADAERRFMLWDSPPEIIKRREAEADLIFRGISASDGSCIEYTRVRSNYRPDWSSAKRIKVMDVLRSFMDGEPQDNDIDQLDNMRGQLQLYKEKLSRIEKIVKE